MLCRDTSYVLVLSTLLMQVSQNNRTKSTRRGENGRLVHGCPDFRADSTATNGALSQEVRWACLHCRASCLLRARLSAPSFLALQIVYLFCIHHIKASKKKSWFLG